MRVAGLLSGTSLDGIDVAITEITDDTIDLLAHDTVPYSGDVREAILSVSNAVAHISTVARLNYLLGELFSEALIATAENAGIPLDSIQLVGSHGQTIFHEGHAVDFCGHRIASSMQIGEAAVIAIRTNIATFSDFRAGDVAAGGQGAPLAPFLDYRLFRSEEIGRIALNIGGIANITVIPAGATPAQVLAFDTGPGNMVMDALEPPFDPNGEKARAGTVNQELLDLLLRDPYYNAPGPKSAGREQYGVAFLRSGIDIATAAELTARTIALSIQRYRGIEEVVVSGGGAHNSYLMERIAGLLPGHRVVTSAEFGVDIDAKEAVLFALLAYESYHSRPCNIPSATGARMAVVLGKMY